MATQNLIVLKSEGVPTIVGHEDFSFVDIIICKAGQMTRFDGWKVLKEKEVLRDHSLIEFLFILGK